MSPAAAALFLPLFSLAAGGLRSPFAFSAASLLAWGVLASAKSSPRLPLAPLWLAWLSWSALSAAASAEPIRGFSDIAYRLSAVAVFSLAAGRCSEDEKIAWTRFAAASVLLLEAVSLFVKLPGFPHVGVLFPYYNYMGAAAAAGLVLGAALALKPERQDRAFGFFCLAASALWLLWAKSRGGLTAAGAGLAVLLFRSGRTRLLFGAMAVGAAALITAFILNADFLKLSHATSNLRPRIWAASLSVATDSPLFGEGPGQFDRGFLRHNFPAELPDVPTRYGIVSKHAHSEFLQEAAETGFPGLVLFAAALLACLLRGLRNDGPSSPFLPIAAAFLAHGFFDNIFALPALEWLFFASLGAANSGAESEKKFPIPLAVAGMVLCAVFWIPRWLIENALSAGERGKLEAALKIAPKDPELWSSLARARLKEAPPRRREAFACLAEAEALHPTNAVYPLIAAQTAADAGTHALVLQLTRRVIQLEPGAAQARLLAAEALLETEEREQAAAAYRDALPLLKPPPEGFTSLYDRMIRGYDPELARRLSARVNGRRVLLP